MFDALLMEVANKAAQDRRYRFQNCIDWLGGDCLFTCWKHIQKNALGPVREAELAQYQKDLNGNLFRLEQQLRRHLYTPHLGVYRHIPKSRGGSRPLGAPGINDAILQLAVARILTAIYKYDFLPDCHCFRPGLGVYNPIKSLAAELNSGQYGMLVEVHVRGYLEQVDHALLLRLLGRRVGDRALLNLIQKWLHAAAYAGSGRRRSAGIPQGEYITPVLGNIYLHYLLDLWLRDYLREYAHGPAYFCRYSYDLGCALGLEADAEQLYKALTAHLERYHLLQHAKLRLWRLDSCRA